MLDRETGEIVERTLPHEGTTVRDFYTAAAANDLDRAWSLLSADGRAIFGDRSRFDGTFTTLQRIEFARLDPSVSGRKRMLCAHVI